MPATILQMPRRQGGEGKARRAFAPLKALWRNLEAEHDRLVLWLPVAAGLGIALYFALPVEPPLIIGAVLGALLTALAALLPPPARTLVFAAMLAAWGGFLAAQIRTRVVAAPVLARDLGYVAVRGQVRWREPTDDGRLRLTLDHVSIARLPPDKTPHRVRITMRGLMSWPDIGDVVEAKASLIPPGGPVAPHAYDYARVAWFQGIGAVGYGGKDLKVIEPASRAGTGPDRWYAELRAGIQKRIAADLPPREAAVATALLTGARAGIQERDVTAMRNAGLAHVLAISGLHLGLLAGLVFFLIRFGLAAIEPLALRLPVKKIAACAALLAAFVYLGISGGAVSTERSFLMLMVVFFAVLIDRPALSLRTVAFAAALILVTAPESLMSASFQMSFAAVIGLIAAYEWWRDRPHPEDGARWPRPARYAAGVFMTTLIAQVAVAPFAIYQFQQFQTFGALGNEAVMPLLAFLIMPAGVLSLAAMPFGLERLPLHVMGWGIDQMLRAAHFTAALPASVVTVHTWPVIALAVCTFGGLWLSLWRRPWRLIGLPIALFGIGIGLLSRPPDVLVSLDGKALAFRVKDGEGWHYGLHGTRAGTYRASNWLKALGAEPNAPLSATKRIQCDALGCIVPAGRGGRVSLVDDGRALAEECASAKVIVSLVRVPDNCTGPSLVLDPLRLYRTGPVALRFADKGRRVSMSHASVRGRPWQGSTLGGDEGK